MEWAKTSLIRFLGPHEYAVLETDGQLRTFLGVVDGKKKNVNWLKNGKFIDGANPTFRAQFWCKSQFSGFRRVHEHVNEWERKETGELEGGNRKGKERKGKEGRWGKTENRKGDRGRGRRREGEEQRYGAWRRCRAAVVEKKGRGERDPRRRGRSCRRATPRCLVRVSPLLFSRKMLTCTIVPRYLRRAFIIVAPYSRCHQHLLPLPLRVTQQRRSRSSSAAVAGDLGCCCSYGGEKRLHHPLRFDIEPLFLTLIDAAAAVSVALKSPLQLPV
nr:uncharacterized protein LOC112763463 [Arachis hypogaea]